MIPFPVFQAVRDGAVPGEGGRGRGAAEAAGGEGPRRGRRRGAIQYANPFGPKSKQKIFDSAVALFAECVFYSESLLVSALIKIHTLVEIPSRSGRRE